MGSMRNRQVNYRRTKTDVYKRQDYHREISEQLAKVLKQLISVKKEDVSVLIVGLGNRAVTPDALGPRVVDLSLIHI